LSAGFAPAHARALHSLSDERFAGGLNDAGTDRKVPGSRRSEAHAVAVATEVSENFADDLSTWIPITKISKAAYDFFDSFCIFAQYDSEALELHFSYGARLAIGGDERTIEVLGGVEKIHDLNAAGKYSGEIVPVILRAVCDLDDAKVLALALFVSRPLKFDVSVQ
jgi:hypothetical protein